MSHFSDTPSGLTTPRVRAKRTTLPQTFKRATWRPWKRKPEDNVAMEKLLIPLPIPHPVHIAISIYNRDSDQPIPLDSDVCADILRSIEDCSGDMVAVNAVARFRGGGGAATESSIDSLDSATSDGTRDSMDIIGSNDICGTETLPCVNRTPNPQMSTANSGGASVVLASAVTAATTPTPTSIDNHSISNQSSHAGSAVTPTTSYHWTLSSLGGNRRRNNNGGSNTETVRVDLASPEDISLDTDSSRVVFAASSFGTTV